MVALDNKYNQKRNILIVKKEVMNNEFATYLGRGIWRFPFKKTSSLN